METSTIVMMVVILAILWGGFAALLVRSMRADEHCPEDESEDRLVEGSPD